MAKQMYTLRDVPKYEHIRAAANKYPDMEPASAATFVLLLRIASDLLALTDDYLAGHNLSQGRFIVLMLLNRYPDTPQNPCELARKAGVTRATMTGLLDGLEREEFITRKTVADDRRMLDVALSPKGKKFLEMITPGYFRLIRRCMAGLTQPEKEQMITLLTKLGATAELQNLANQELSKTSC